MRSLTKRTLTSDQLSALLRASAGTGCRVEAELTDGWFNAAYRVRLDDGRPAVVKVAPPPEAAVLRYERGIMATEIMVHRRAAALDGVPLPELLHAGPDFMALSVLPGTPWDKADDRLPPGRQPALRRELGRIAARLHTLTSQDGRYGYPAPEAGLSAADWPSAFAAMVEAMLEDAVRWHSPLGVPAEEIRELVAAGAPALARVDRPRLVHFDLWPGNVFVSGDGTAVTGLIDHERAFFGDPAAELVSLGLGGDTGPDSDLVAGYREAGGHLDFGPGMRQRLALYRLYLGLIIVVECGPRGYGADHLRSCRAALARWTDEARAAAAAC
ncbi:aminoglycoside phosphotransferase family protein [Streptomyces sp. NPDC046977]|uniref:phosphotransferase family protein n=1 Tax=Streptomyces sp. NPDC046977 TaxID=3154703 RepID=UPI0033BFCC1A